MAEKSIQLSICIPAYNRPVGLQKALQSIIDQHEINAKALEIIVSDDSTTPGCEEITKELLQNWSGWWKYFYNSPSLGMARNWNRCIKEASGKYVLVLHDDDYLEAKGIYSIFQALNSSSTEMNVLLFGVNIVDTNYKILRKQSHRNIRYLPPKEAVKSVLTNSSFVRFPGIVFSRKIFAPIGYFNSHIGGVADLEMWVRLFKKYGVWCFPQITAAYTVHSNALTMQMFNTHSILRITTIFENIANEGYFTENQIKKFRSSFIHQFILAGTFRKIRRDQWHEAKEIMNLFNDENVKKLPPCFKWYLPRRILHFMVNLYSWFTEVKS